MRSCWLLEMSCGQCTRAIFRSNFSKLKSFISPKASKRDAKRHRVMPLSPCKRRIVGYSLLAMTLALTRLALYGLGATSVSLPYDLDAFEPLKVTKAQFFKALAAQILLYGGFQATETGWRRVGSLSLVERMEQIQPTWKRGQVDYALDAKGEDGTVPLFKVATTGSSAPKSELWVLRSYRSRARGVHELLTGCLRGTGLQVEGLGRPGSKHPRADALMASKGDAKCQELPGHAGLLF